MRYPNRNEAHEAGDAYCGARLTAAPSVPGDTIPIVQVELVAGDDPS